MDTALLVREDGGTRFGCTATEEIMEECKRRLSIDNQVQII